MANNLNRKWMVTAFHQNKTARKRLGDGTPSQNISSKNGTHSISELLANNNIEDYFLKNNLSKWVNPQTATLGQTINSNIQANIPNFDFNTAVTTRGNSQQTQKYDKIFTPEDIGQMTPEEFSKNEKTINEQLQQGLITPTTQRKQNYSGYRNPVSGIIVQDKIVRVEILFYPFSSLAFFLSR